jgi:hypothetical protein
MGHRRHIIHKCHTCKRRRTSGGVKKGGSWDRAERAGWVFLVWSTLGKFIWLCPACARKHEYSKLPPGPLPGNPKHA